MVDLVTPPQPPLIALRGIRKCYGGDSDHPPSAVLHDIDLTIRAGEFVAIVGASGSGKSTLMHIIGCLDRPSEGCYLFNGEDVSAMNADQLAALRRETFGFVFQGYHLIDSDSARENVEMPAIYAGLSESSRIRRATELLTRLGLGDKLNNRPSQLSGGQQQRVSIARALMNDGQVLLADEPTGALDSRSGAEVLALLRELANTGRTVILVTHDHDVAHQAQRIIEIRDGRITNDKVRACVELTAASPPKAAHTTHDLPPLGFNAAGAELQEAARTAWRGMRVNYSRTMLTLLGVVIGVASVIVMLAIGEGARRQVIAQMGVLGTTTMYLGSHAPPGGGPVGRLSDEDLQAIEALPEISRVMPVIGDPITVRYGSVDRQVYVFAGGAEMPAIHHWAVAEGRFFTPVEDRDLANVVVLGHNVGREFFPDSDTPLGRHLLIGNSPFEVIGVMAERGADSEAQDYDEMVFIPYNAGRARVYQGKNEPDYVVIEAVSAAQVYAAEDAMRALLLGRHHGREDFRIGNAAARLQAEVATRHIMTMMLGLIAAVSLVVGGIGIMNVMLMTVRERTREIGIRIASGARQRDILRQFLIEAMLATLMGGGAGLVIGLVVGAVLITLNVTVVFSVTVMAGAFLCAVLTGVVFGYRPAKTAAGLDPVVALAGE